MNRDFLKNEELEELANKINKKFYPERLLDLINFDPYDFIENKLNLEVEWKYLSPNYSILGMLFFGNL